MAKQIPGAQALQRCLIAMFVAITLASSLYVMIPFAAGCAGSGYTGLDSYPYGVPSRPMVYRVLMPAIDKVIVAAIPSAIAAPLKEKLIAWRDSDNGKAQVKHWFLRQPPLADNQIIESATVLFTCWLTLLAFLWMFYRLVRAVFPQSLSYALLAPLLALQLIPILSINNAYIYDFAELFFSCLLLFLLLKERFAAYLVCFALATLNKETTLLMIAFFATWFYPLLPRKLYIKLLAAQCILYGAIKGALTLYFSSYPGELIGPHVTISGNLWYIFHWGDYKYIAMILLLMGYRWKQKPAFLRGTLLMVLLHAAIYIVLCMPGEYRDFYCSLPAILMMITHSLVSWCGLDEVRLLKTG